MPTNPRIIRRGRVKIGADRSVRMRLDIVPPTGGLRTYRFVMNDPHAAATLAGELRVVAALLLAERACATDPKGSVRQ
jgi:hypothetical protein